MPNFDQCERLMIDGIKEADRHKRSRFAAEIATLPRDRTVKLFDDRSELEIEAWLVRARDSIRSILGLKTLRLTSSRDNSDGNDLYEESIGAHLEIKAGDQHTIGNPGASSLIKAIGGQGVSDEYRRDRLPKQLQRREMGWRALSATGDELTRLESRITSSREEEVDWLASILRRHLNIGQAAPTFFEFYCKNVCLGLSKLEAIEAQYAGDSDSVPLILVSRWEDGLVVSANAFDPKETLVVAFVGRSEVSAQIKLLGERSGRAMTLQYAYKNSWPSSKARVDPDQFLPARYWVSNPWFNPGRGARA